MNRCDLRPAAEADLVDIWRYSVAHWGVERAELYMAGLQRAMKRAAEAPLEGRQMKIGERVIYMWRAASHRVFYSETPHGIEVLRILHAQMDFGRHLI